MTSIDEATRAGMRARAGGFEVPREVIGTYPAHFAFKERPPAPLAPSQMIGAPATADGLEALRGQVAGLATRLDELPDLWFAVRELQAAPPIQHVTWADLIDRWTSRKWLAAVVPGAVAFLTLLGTIFGDVDPRIPLAIGGFATFLGTVFIVKEGDTDRAVAVAQVEKAQGPVPPVR